MVVFCEECGEKYVFEEEEFKGSKMMFICRVCNDIIRIPPTGSVGPKSGERINAGRNINTKAGKDD
jgi:RNase P subunit RPR2